MRHHYLFNLVSITALSATCTCASAALIVKAEHVNIVPEPVGGNAVTGFIEVFVQNDNPNTSLTGFQVQAQLPDGGQRDVTFNNFAGSTLAHPPVLAAAAPIALFESVNAKVIKTSLDGVPLPEDGGLIRLQFSVAPGIEGVFPVTLVSLHDDPHFGTALLGAGFANLPITVQPGSITVAIPEPAAVGALAPLLLAVLRLRRRSPAAQSRRQTAA